LALLDGQAVAAPAKPTVAKASAKPARAPSPALVWAKGPGRLPLIFGGIGLGLVIVVGGGLAVLTARPHAKPASAAIAPAGAPRTELVRRAVVAALPNVSCSWLDIDSVAGGPSGVDVRMSGVAGDVLKAQAAIEQAAGSAGAPLANLAFDVSPLKDPQICARLDAFNAVRADTTAGSRLTTAQTAYELRPAPDDPTPKAHPVVTVALGDPSLGFALA